MCEEGRGFLTKAMTWPREFADLTFDPSDSEEQLWVWQYEAEDGTHNMFMDLEEEVRFRVVQETFVDTLPTDGERNITHHLHVSIVGRVRKYSNAGYSSLGGAPIVSVPCRLSPLHDVHVKNFRTHL